jgi:rhodanese-related sulfurtransferase
MDQFVEFVSNHWGLFLALVVILGLLVGNEVSRAFRGFKDLPPTEATRLLNHEDAVLVDVREAGEVHDGRIANSVHIPLGTFAGNLNKLDKHKGKPVIVYCRSGHRSARACAMLRKNGFEPVYNLSGGFMAWQNANLPISKK